MQLSVQKERKHVDYVTAEARKRAYITKLTTNKLANYSYLQHVQDEFYFYYYEM